MIGSRAKSSHGRMSALEKISDHLKLIVRSYRFLLEACPRSTSSLIKDGVNPSVFVTLLRVIRKLLSDQVGFAFKEDGCERCCMVRKRIKPDEKDILLSWRKNNPAT
jgi:hypothetical protein